MEAQLYQQTVNPPTTPPKVLRWLIVGVAASIVLLIALPVTMLINRDGLVESIIRESDVSSEHLDWVVVIVMVYTIGLHLIDVVLLLWLTPRVLRGRHWARIVLTAYLVVATFFSIENSAGKGAMFLWVVIPTDLLHLVMATLLWAPRSVRAYFAAHRGERRVAHEPS